MCQIMCQPRRGVLPVVRKPPRKGAPRCHRLRRCKGLPEAFEVVKAMQTDGLDWGEGYRPLGRRALAEIIEGRMAEDVDRWLGNLDGAAACDRRNKTGAGGLKRPVLVVLSLHPDGRKEIVDYRLARAESAAEWERFLDDLYARGLTGEGLEMTCVDGGGQGGFAGGPAHRVPRHPDPALLDAQDTSSTRFARPIRMPSGRIFTLPPQPHRGPERRQAQTLGRCMPQGRRMPARRSRRSADLFPLQGPRSTQAGQNHQRYRAPVPRGPAKNPPHGGFPGPHLDGRRFSLELKCCTKISPTV